MKIVLATPLYPPDIAEPAPYIKELAGRLSNEHTVTVLTYGTFVEPVPNVRIVTVPKRHILPIRLLHYFFRLMSTARHANVVYAENGPSVELPLLAFSFFTRTPYVVHLGDSLATERTGESQLLRRLATLVSARAAHVIADSPLQKPEILPLLPRPTEAEERYEDSWRNHLTSVNDALCHG